MTDVIERIVTGRVTEAADCFSFSWPLRLKGETPEERTAIAQVMRGHAQHIPTEIQDAMDNCGTGGDKSFSFNISTTASFVLAGGGIHMAKHGNRSISSKSGSADVLQALGINLDLKPAELGKVFDKTGIVFLFAKNMHPAMKYIMPARLELGIPTIMNLTGPLIHPMALETQLLGISRPELLESTAQVLKNMGRKRAIVVAGPEGLDEAGLNGTTKIALLENGEITLSSFTPEDLGMERYAIEDIRGGNAQENAEILLSVLQNEPSPFLETTVLNAGLGFYANGKVASIKEGVALARQVIASGKALEKLRLLQEYQKMSQEFLARILEQKAREVEQMELEEIQPLRQTYRLAEFLKNHQDRLQVIAEVKKASPSLGDINLNVDIVQQAQTYEANGAVMISVLTDEVFFKGHLDYLREISSQVKHSNAQQGFYHRRKANHLRPQCRCDSHLAHCRCLVRRTPQGTL